jgi:hypothetical protein
MAMATVMIRAEIDGVEDLQALLGGIVDRIKEGHILGESCHEYEFATTGYLKGESSE